MSETLNLMDPEVRANPYPHYAKLRRMPICRVEPGGMWAVSRYDDVVAALKSPTLSSTGWKAMSQPPWLPENPVANSMLMEDPPVHTRLRKLVSGVFTASGIARMEPRIRMISDVLAEQVVRLREVEFVRDFALPLPSHVIGDMLGLPSHLHPHLKHWSDHLTSVAMGPHSPEQIERIQTEVAVMKTVLGEVIASRRVHPGDDILTDLIRHQEDGHSLTDEELMSFFFLLVVAGMETTCALLSQCMIILSRSPELFRRVCAERGRLIPQFLEEVLRFEPPGPMLFRVTVAPTVINGVEIPPGNIVLLLLASATHDETHFPQPEEIVLERDQKQTSLAFGHGIHYCLGAPLARMEARFGLEALLLRLKGVSPGREPITYSTGFSSRTPLKVPLILDPK